MKKDVTTILGIIIVVATIIVTFLDMYLSTIPTYTFELEGWHIFTGLGIGIALIVVPEKKLSKLIIDIVKWKFNGGKESGK